jgi:general nucleoside transport system ATP-binding protein
MSSTSRNAASRAGAWESPSGELVLETRDITKRYGPVVANDRLGIEIRPGEVLGLLGENGAGKSTLLSVLSGMTEPDAGDVLVDGRPVHFRGPADAIGHGIGTVYQQFSLVPTLTVREQLRLAGWRSPGLPAILGDRVTGDERIDALSLGQRQRVEIAKALLSEPRILLLDEPTSILAPTEVEQLFALLDGIRRQGVAIVLVTHKLREAIALSDRIVVLRHGAVAARVERPSAGWDHDVEASLLGAMFGEAPDPAPGVSLRPKAPVPVQDADGPPLLAARGLTSRMDTGHRSVRDVSLEIRQGEICAIVGIDGQGQRELAEILAGYRAADGEIVVRGRSLSGMSAPGFRRAGVGYLTDDRHGEGGVGSLSIAMNLMLKRQRGRPFSRRGILDRRAISTDAARLAGAWSIIPRDVDLPLDVLSGGNVQKTLLAREMALSPTVLVANKPTHGLDAQTQDLVWRAMREITGRGGAVLVLATDLDEAFAHADRVAVILNGRVSALAPVRSTSRMDLARMMVAGW